MLILCGSEWWLRKSVALWICGRNYFLAVCSCLSHCSSKRRRRRRRRDNRLSQDSNSNVIACAVDSTTTSACPTSLQQSGQLFLALSLSLFLNLELWMRPQTVHHRLYILFFLFFFSFLNSSALRRWMTMWKWCGISCLHTSISQISRSVHLDNAESNPETKDEKTSKCWRCVHPLCVCVDWSEAWSSRSQD